LKAICCCETRFCYLHLVALFGNQRRVLVGKYSYTKNLTGFRSS